MIAEVAVTATAPVNWTMADVDDVAHVLAGMAESFGLVGVAVTTRTEFDQGPEFQPASHPDGWDAEEPMPGQLTITGADDVA